MKQVEEKDTVLIAYTGTLDNETVFETVEESEPKTINLADENTPRPFKLTLPGMKIGETRVVKMTAEEGEYGIRRSDLLQQIPKTKFTDKIQPKVGLVLSMSVERDGTNHQIPATIVEVSDELVTIDYNHPLAGHPLNYEVTVIDVIKP